MFLFFLVMKNGILFLFGVLMFFLLVNNVFADVGGGGGSCDLSVFDSDGGLSVFSAGYVSLTFSNCSTKYFYDFVDDDGVLHEFVGSVDGVFDVGVVCSDGVVCNGSGCACLSVDRDGDGFSSSFGRVVFVGRVFGVDDLFVGVGDVLYFSDRADCDDFDASVSPGVVEGFFSGNCGDGVDNDCDNAVDGDDSGCPVCGNGVVEVGEECDDGNFVDFDGCSNCSLDVGVLGVFGVGFNVSVSCGRLSVHDSSSGRDLDFGDSCSGLDVSGSGVCFNESDCLFFVNGSPVCVPLGGNLSVDGRLLVCMYDIFNDRGVWCGSFINPDTGSPYSVTFNPGDQVCELEYGFCDWVLGNSSGHNCSVLFGGFWFNLSGGDVLCSCVDGVCGGDCFLRFVNFSDVVLGLCDCVSCGYNFSDGSVFGFVRRYLVGDDWVCHGFKWSRPFALWELSVDVLYSRGIGFAPFNPWCFGNLVGGSLLPFAEGAVHPFSGWCGLSRLGDGFVGVAREVRVFSGSGVS